MKIQFDALGTKEFFNWFTSKIVELVLPSLEKSLSSFNSDEELLTRKEVSERIFRCSVDTFDLNFRYAPGFPKIMQGEKERYPKKLVEKWIHQNTKF